MNNWNTDKALLGGFFIAHWMNEDAEIRAAQANHQNRISAYIAQGYNYQQAVAQVQTDYAWEAEQRGPAGASWWIVLVLLAWEYISVAAVWAASSISWLFFAAALLAAVAGLWGLRAEYRCFRARRAWAASR